MSRATIRRWAWIIGVLALWEFACRLQLVNPIILAAPSRIVAAGYSDGGAFLEALRVTAVSLVIAVAIAWVLGIFAGIIIGASRLAFASFNPIMSSLFAIPLIVWYPMLVVWAGIGAESKILYGIMTGALPVALHAAAGVRLVDTRYVTFARSVGAGAWTVYAKIFLPFALPSILAGIRIGTSVAVASVIVGEMLASTGGLGFLITYHRTIYNTGHVFLGMLLAVGCVVLANGLLSKLERRYGEWRRLQREASSEA